MDKWQQAQMTHWSPIASERPLADWLDSMNSMQKLGLLQVPVVSDVAGLLGDVQMYQEQPETRGLLNYAMTGAGLLPGIPAVSGMVKGANKAGDIALATARTRPSEYVQFGQPLTGPSGAKLVGYEWKWQPYEYVDARGEGVMKRVSDWDESIPNAETGRNVVHQFHIERNGTKDIVSAESAAKLLGLSGPEQTKPLKSLVSASKTLAWQKMQLAEAESALQRYTEVSRDVARQELPELRVRGRVAGDPPWITPDASIYEMGDQTRWYRPSSYREYEPKNELSAMWRSARIKEQLGDVDAWKLRSMIDDLSKRIKRQEAKLR